SMAFRESYKDVLLKALDKADSIIVYNDFIKNLLLKYNNNVNIIPSGVDVEKFKPSKEIKKEKKRLKILMSGRAAEYAKGLTILENAFKLLLTKRDDIVLEITADEYFRHYENRFQGQHFILRKWVNQDSLPEVYKDADIVVVPSIWIEPFGIVAVEAMSSGIPVIASRIGGLKDIVIDGETGLHFEPNNFLDLMEKIEFLLNNPKVREEMSKKGRKRAEALYSWDKIIDNYYIPLFS
ncbi:MAG: glycosyltransferase family 1 protein, partial [Candidatus Schekmanbacteria bacterium]